MTTNKQPWYKTIDWMINWQGFILLAACICLVYMEVDKPSLTHWQNNPFEAWSEKGSLGIPLVYASMIVSCGISLVLSQPKEKKAFEWKKFVVGFSFVWIFTLLSKWIAAQKQVHNASIGDSIWAIFFGCCFYQIIKRVNPKLLHCLELAKQTELYIATSLVLLVINYSKLKSIIGNSLFIAWIDTPILFVAFSYIGVKVFSLRPKQSMILTGCTVICGSSAAAAIRNSLKAKEKDQKDAILISSLLTIPCIIILPIISTALQLSDNIAGSWFGGCVDSTGAVFATATQFRQESVSSAAVVKMVQNILIAPISVFVVAFYIKNQATIDTLEESMTITRKQSRQGSGSSKQHSKIDFEKKSNSINNQITDKLLPAVHESRRKESHTQKNGQISISKKVEEPKYLALVWDRFPKFVLGFVLSIIIFNISIVSDKLEYGRDFIFTVSEWFSTCSFVSIGMSLQLAKGDGKQLMILTGIYLIIQIVDIFTTLGYSYLSYTYF